MLDEDEVDATAPETPEASAGGAAPAGEPAAPAEPAVAAAPETPATAPIPGVDDYDWGKYDPSAKGYLEGFHEDLRPWAEKFHGHYASQLEEQRTLARYHQELAEAASYGQQETPLATKLQGQVAQFETQLQERDTQIADLTAQLEAAQGNYTSYVEKQNTQIFDNFWETSGAEIKAATPEIQDAFKGIVDLDDLQNSDYVYLEYEDTWKVAQAGKADDLKKLHSEGVPAAYAMKLLFPAGAAPAAPVPERPKPSATAEVISGADGTRSAPVDPSPKPKPVHKEFSNPRERRNEAIRRAMRGGR